MTIDRLRETLSAIGPPPDARELSEMLWLACHITPSEERPSATVPAPVVPDSTEVPQPPPPTTPATRPPPAPEPRTGLHPPSAPGAEPVGEASEVLVPTAPMLADALGLQRAFRPLKRRIPSRHRRELDEEATAARIADTRLWTPVLVPSPERWLTLALVVDTGPTMRLWRPLARELAEMLIRQGAFQDVHITYLHETGRITSSPDAPPQDPRTLLDASGRQAVLVLSDCSGPHWWNGRATHTLRLWAQAGPTAILQPLAERLWRRTAAPTTPGLAALPRPGAPNTDLRFTPFDGVVPPGVPVPVLELTPRWFAGWARLVSGSAPQPTALTTLGPRPSASVPVHRERELPITERVRRFLSTASPDAAELAAHVAVSVPSLPVMRLIQHRILGGSGPGQLAEVLLSGLLRPTGDVRYEFVPGAREALLDTLPRPEALHTHRVLEAVSAEIERRAGTTAETFRALLPADGGPVRLTAETDHFALVTPRTRTHLAPTPSSTDFSGAPDLLELLGRPVDELIGDSWDRPPHPTVIGLDGQIPVTLDVLNGHPDLPHGVIRAPRAARRWLIRAIVWSLALGHSPDTVNFAFAAFSTRGRSLGDLRNLPHVAADVRDFSTDPALTSDFPQILETERRRRESILRSAGVDTWDEYQAAIADGRALDPLPALLVIIDNARPLLDAHPDLSDPLVRLYETGSAQGIKFIVCTPDDLPPPGGLMSLAGWNMGPTGHGGDLAFLHVLARRTHPRFLPARVSPDLSAPIVELMRRQGPQAYRLHTPAPPNVLAFDVLRLNGGGPSGMFEETWARPSSEPRNPAIGYDTEGNVLSLYPLDFSSGIPHGLIVGPPERRQRIVRAITFALAAGHSPANLNIVLAGLGEHPLGEPLNLPHVRYSEDELLGHPEKLQRFIDYLSRELDARPAPSPLGFPGVSEFGSDEGHWPEPPPRLLVVADVSLTLPLSRPQVGEALLSLAQRGRALGVQLLLTSTAVENTTIWDRFLPLLGWRIAAGPRPAAELQRVFGQGDLAFSDRHTAYLLAGGGSPHRFTVAEEPSEPVVADFVRRTRNHARTGTVPAGTGTVPADPERSRAVLIGVSRYTSLPDLPAVRNNLEGLKRSLCDPLVWGLPERNCVVLAEPRDVAQVLETVERAAQEAGNALLVYYAGHGLRDEEDGEFSLALPTSRPGEVSTTLTYQRLHRAITRSGSPRHKVLLLDCCSSGRTLDDEVPPETPPGDRTFVMSSTSEIEAGPTVLGAPYTTFTGELIATVEEGLAGAPAGLDMRTLHQALYQRLTDKGRPRPLSSHFDDGSGVVCLFRNRAHEATPGASGETLPDGRRPVTGAAILNRTIRELDGTVPDVAVRTALREILEEAESRASSAERPAQPLHLVFAGAPAERLRLEAARVYGHALAELGFLSDGEVIDTSWDQVIGRTLTQTRLNITRLFTNASGKVLFLREAQEPSAKGASPYPVLRDLMAPLLATSGSDPVVIVNGEQLMQDGRTLQGSNLNRHFRRTIVFTNEVADRPQGIQSRLPPSEQLTLFPDERVQIGVVAGTSEPAFIDFAAYRHLLISGPSGSGKAALLRQLIEAVARDPDSGRIIYFLDRERPSSRHRHLAEHLGVRYAAGDDTVPLLTEALHIAEERRSGRMGRDIYLFFADRGSPFEADAFTPLMPFLASSHEHGLHLVLSHHQRAVGEPPGPVVEALHELGAPALLVGNGNGWEADLWNLPRDLRTSIAPGHAVLTHEGRHRLIELSESP